MDTLTKEEIQIVESIEAQSPKSIENVNHEIARYKTIALKQKMKKKTTICQWKD